MQIGRRSTGVYARLRRDDDEALRKMAERFGVPLSSLIALACQEYVAKHHADERIVVKLTEIVEPALSAAAGQ